MTVETGVTAITALLAGTFSVLLAIAVLRRWDRGGAGWRGHGRANRLDTRLQPMVFLFRKHQLVDATAPARTLLSRITAPDNDWQRVLQWIGPRFPDLGARLDQIDRLGRIEAVGTIGSGSAMLRVVAEDLGDDLLRIAITDPEAENAGIVVDSMSQQAMEDELDLLRRALDQTPMLVWRQDEAERVTWANAAYLQRAEARGDGVLGWPLPRLLDTPRPVPGPAPRPGARRWKTTARYRGMTATATGWAIRR